MCADLPDKKWEVSLGKHLGKATVSEAGIDYWANQIRHAHAADTGLVFTWITLMTSTSAGCEKYVLVNVLIAQQKK